MRFNEMRRDFASRILNNLTRYLTLTTVTNIAAKLYQRTMASPGDDASEHERYVNVIVPAAVST